MISNEFIERLSQQAARLFPAASAAQQDLENRLYDLLKGSFDRLNLVTREEFDAQLSVLERANRTIADLERKVAELERQVGGDEGEASQQEPQDVPPAD